MRAKTTEFDPFAYIESSFLDTQKPETKAAKPTSQKAPLGLDEAPKEKFRRTEMRAPRPRRAAAKNAGEKALDPELQRVWESLPGNIAFLMSYFDDAVTANYYTGDFKETRQALIKRLLDPELSLEETSRLLGVCPATVRRYTNRGWLEHHRTQGAQRRFRLSAIGKFVAEHGRFPEK